MGDKVSNTRVEDKVRDTLLHFLKEKGVRDPSVITYWEGDRQTGPLTLGAVGRLRFDISFNQKMGDVDLPSGCHIERYYRGTVDIHEHVDDHTIRGYLGDDRLLEEAAN